MARRECRNNKYDPCIVMLVYIYNLEGGPMELPGRTRINLNEELVNKGLANNRPGLQQPITLSPQALEWKANEYLGISLNKMFWGHVTWVSRAGEIYLHDVKAGPKLIEIRKWLDEVYNQTEPTETDLRCQPGDICIAKYEKLHYLF